MRRPFDDSRVNVERTAESRDKTDGREAIFVFVDPFLLCGRTEANKEDLRAAVVDLL